MKVLSLNFVNCAAKACKATSKSFPLHPKDAELVQDEIELNPAMLINVLPRLDWAALRTTSSEAPVRGVVLLGFPLVRAFIKAVLLYGYHAFSLTEDYSPSQKLGFPQLPEQAPSAEQLQADEKTLKDLHHLLLETQISEGKLVCGNCGHEYAIKEGIANFLLPSHLV
ncbi:hypothetical protein LLEC1_00136 [Akanthomyces lecanii]|uniref:Trm112p-like protein n=1 Tax=Cordyceps confragosa TaxID=2714763 RepID=A0A179I447_CORDF|nr:hypothetical protein LLEC1_00136 [Akanthomyces lecanii]